MSRTFGIIKHFDKFSRKHSVRCVSSSLFLVLDMPYLLYVMGLQVMFEDGAVEFLDMSKEDWELVTL